MKKLENVDLKITEINRLDSVKINAGCFAYDAGWALGFLWDVVSGDRNGAAVSVVKYDTHEH